MLGHHLPPTIGRFESILEARPNERLPNRLDPCRPRTSPNLGHDGKTRQSLSNLLPMRLDRYALGTHAPSLAPKLTPFAMADELSAAI